MCWPRCCTHAACTICAAKLEDEMAALLPYKIAHRSGFVVSQTAHTMTLIRSARCQSSHALALTNYYVMNLSKTDDVSFSHSCEWLGHTLQRRWWRF